MERIALMGVDMTESEGIGKLVVLDLNGDLARQGFQVQLEIGPEGERAKLKSSGALPCEPQLSQEIAKHWLERYRVLGAPSSRQVQPKGLKLDGTIKAKVRACEQSAQSVSVRLNQWLESESFRKLDTKMREALQPEERVRFTIRTNCEEIQKLPWHTWQLFQQYPDAEIAFSSLEFEPSTVEMAAPTGKVRILAILGHSEDIDVQHDRQTLMNLPHADVTFLVEPQPGEISDRLWEQPWDILFFAGHSETEGDAGKIFINETDFLTLDDIWYGLRQAVNRGLKLAIFNSCDGLALARRLDETRIPQMIVMRDLVPDLVAQKFLLAFLLNFSDGKSFETSVREAREQLQGLEKSLPCASWLPVVWQHPDCISPRWDDLNGRSRRSSRRTTLFNRRRWGAIALAVAMGVLSQFWMRPKVATYLNNAGAHYINQERHDRAIPYFQLSLKIHPEQPSALNNLAGIYDLLQEKELALEMYRKSKRLGNPWGCHGEAISYVDNEQFSQAEALLRQCLLGMISQENAMGEYVVRSHLGFALFKIDSSIKLEDYAEATEHLQRAIILQPNEGLADCVFAQVLEAQGKLHRSLNHWSLCVQNAQDQHANEAEWIRMGKMKLRQSKKL
ncbi:CHAT domain-containing tetratricopeptide repeat protein [Roseofilum casamattae]|uniref:CHAT domain-containing protein n=1 Tax=Roseofilum casamattae BLCC-M143 TaxID=3022442 RepID=A0ABT7BZ05_9CYAN|nr:CHAT domain-containing protein [Roseofilum casamattae]MDJ1184436.1 CHAT domain-containing protein [Roseofilum casamattae BLCC-M143]